MHYNKMTTILRDLRCPICKGKLIFILNIIYCKLCDRRYEIINGIPIMLEDINLTKKWDIYYKLQKKPTIPVPYYAKYIKDGVKNILDAGSGDGAMSVVMADLAEKIYCIDLSIWRLKLLVERKIDNLIPICASVTNLPFEKGFFDVIMSIFVVEHLNEHDLRLMLNEFRRCIKKNGYCIIATDARFYCKYLKPVLQSIKSGRLIYDNPTHINLFYPQELKTKLELAGFKVFYEDFWRIGERLHIGRFFLGLLPLGIKEKYLTYGFVFICRAL